MNFNIFKNSAYGIVGFLVPSLVLLISYPVILSEIGVEAFGIFILANSFAGTLAVADLGFSLAAIRFIGRSHSISDNEGISNILNASLCAYIVLGLVGVILINILAPTLANLLRVQEAWQQQAVYVFRLTSIQVPLMLLISVFISYFKGLGEYRISSLMLSLLTILTYGSSAIGVKLGKADLVGITIISLSAHIIIIATAIIVAKRLSYRLYIPFRFRLPPISTFRKLARFGSVMFVNSLASLVVTHLPTYLIGYLIGPTGVSVYSIANTITLKAHALINSATEVLFPFASQSGDTSALAKPFKRMMIGSVLISAVVLAPIGLFPHPVLNWWVGGSLADQASGLLQVLALSAFFISLTPAPYHLLNGLGTPELNTLGAVIHLCMFLGTIGILTLSNNLNMISFGIAFIAANACLVIYYQCIINQRIGWYALRNSAT